MDLIKHKENIMIQLLAKKTAEKVGEGKTIYQIWMREDNDLV